MEQIGLERFADNAVTSAFFESLQIHVQGVARTADDRTGVTQLANGFGRVRAVHHRHDKIHQDGIIPN